MSQQRHRLIQLIHVAKRQLGLDDQLYRDILQDATGKQSCKAMTGAELDQALTAMKKRGFKTSTKANKRLSPAKPNQRNGEVQKIRAIWITMHHHGIVKDRSETALDAYVRRMTLRNKGQGVDHVGWLNKSQAFAVLEALKNWHKRELIERMTKSAWVYPVNQFGQPAHYPLIVAAYEEQLSQEAAK